MKTQELLRSVKKKSYHSLEGKPVNARVPQTAGFRRYSRRLLQFQSLRDVVALNGRRSAGNGQDQDVAHVTLHREAAIERVGV